MPENDGVRVSIRYGPARNQERILRRRRNRTYRVEEV